MASVDEVAHEIAERLMAAPGRHAVCVWRRRSSWADPYNYEWARNPQDHPYDAEIVAEDIFDLSDIDRPVDPSAVDRFAAYLYEWVTTFVDGAYGESGRVSGRVFDLDEFDVEQFDVPQTV